MSSNCDSVGCPIDHDGNQLEFGVFSSETPIAIRGDVMRDILSGSGQDVNVTHLETEFVDGSWVKPSSLGGIPVVERVEIEDVTDGGSSEGPMTPRSANATGTNHTSATVHAMMSTMKHEREELYSARKKLMEVLQFLKKRGFSEMDVLKGLKADGFGASQLDRDEFGMPCASNVSEDKVENVLHQSTPVAPQVFADTPKKVTPDPFVDKLKGKLGDEVKGSSVPTPAVQGEKVNSQSWANLLKKDVPTPSFKYFPVDKGSTIVDPPVEVLRKGNEKFKFCVVGTFSKGTHSYKIVSDFAFRNWRSRGLQAVHQKDNITYLFRFASEDGVNEVLSRGTWYVERRPMILTTWGQMPGATVISNLPLWVKFSHVPDCYWTDEGLARIASVIGEPLRADAATSRLEVMPFAKLQVKYKLGDPLPNEIQVSVIHPCTEVKSTATVLVSYPVRPLNCSGCHSLGHSIAACPSVTRVWQRKNIGISEETKATIDPTSSNIPTQKDSGGSSTVKPLGVEQNEEWTEVKRKNSGSISDCDSPSPTNMFKNLKKVDEIDNKHGVPVHASKRLTKSQKKKLKASLGTGSPSQS